MLQIDDVVVSFDVLREKFLCNLDACKGECCIEGILGDREAGRGTACDMG